MSWWWMKASSGGLGLTLILSIATLAQAQPNNATINASATVLQPVTVVAQSDLDFGNVFPGVNKSVLLTDAGAGSWYVTGVSSAEVDLSLATPANLSDGGNNLPIQFGAGDAGYNTANDPSTATGFDPAAGASTNLSGAALGDLWVWIGGQVQPVADQPAGLYTGTITLTVDYTGN